MPVEMHTTLSAKNAYVLVHARICNGAEASLSWKLFRTYFASCTSIVQVVVCRPFLMSLLLSWPNPSTYPFYSRYLSKSTLTHDTVTAVVSHTRIIQSSALVQDSSSLSMGHTRAWPHSRLTTEFTHHRNLFSPFFAHVYNTTQFGFVTPGVQLRSNRYMYINTCHYHPPIK